MSRLYGKKRDVTHRDIRKTFEQLGCLVRDVDGEFDMVVLDAQTGVHLIDAKAAETSPRTENQKDMIRDGWPLEFCWSIEMAVGLVAGWRRRSQ